MDEARPYPVRVVVVVGTRPEAIKMLPVIAALQRTGVIQPYTVSTGQHRKMVGELFAAANIPIDAELTINRERGDLNEVMTQVMIGVDELLRELQIADPGSGLPLTAGVLVHGDTTSAAGAALAAMNRRVPVVHVEAGLRTRDWWQPWPEEVNRQIIGRVTAMHFSPTRHNMANLIREAIPEQRIFVTGNSGIDALFWAVQQPANFDPKLQAIMDSDAKVMVVTAHRRENWGAGLIGIANAVSRVATTYPDLQIVVPLHPNPTVRETVRPVLEMLANVTLVEPVEYIEFSHLIRRAHLILTDSGGIQEEAPAFDVPVLVCREETERTEGLEAGTLRLVGTNPDTIVAAVDELLTDPAVYERMANTPNPYGDGLAADRIAGALMNLAHLAPPPIPFGPGYSRSEVLEAAGYGRYDRASSTLRDPDWTASAVVEWWDTAIAD